MLMKKFLFVVSTFLFVALAVVSCTATRTVTTSASSYKSGDTTTTIVTKTVESYNAVKQH